MRQPTSIDVTDIPELRRIAEEVRDTREPVVLLTEVGEIAVLVPIQQQERRPHRRPSQAEIDAVMSAAGSWEGLVDVEELKAQWNAARGSNRPPVDL